MVAVADVSSLPSPPKEDLDDTSQHDLVTVEAALLDDVMRDELYLIQSRRAFIGGVAGTATLGSIAMCTCGCQGRQKFFANMMNNGVSNMCIKCVLFCVANANLMPLLPLLHGNSSDVRL